MNIQEYIFGPNERAKVYIGSSDLMTRNLVRRVEICVPVLDEKLKKKVIKILDTIMDKNNRIAILNSDSSYTHLNPNKDSCQEIFIREATLEKNRIESRKAEKETLSKANLSSSEKGKKAIDKEQIIIKSLDKKEEKVIQIKNLSFLERLKLLFFPNKK